MRIRDAVHGDLDFTKDEEYCIRSPVFQRLHTIKQLGTAFHVYPSAMHTRFEHSLGVCYQVKKIIFSIENRAERKRFSTDEIRLLSIAGLLHDITHTPFKHTLERDSAIFKEQPADISYSRRFEQMRLGSHFKEDFVEELLKILTTSNSETLSKPYQAQLIQDTFSADLLDYARRDTKFTGITRDYDERIYDHIGIVHVKNKDHFGVNLMDESRKNTASAMTELINLLEVRYVLNERVYLYPTKIAADSLLVKGFRALLASDKLSVSIFEEMSDEEVVNFLASHDNKLASFYGQLLKNRCLPKLACTLTESDFKKSAERSRVIALFRGRLDLDKWAKCEAQIAKEAGTDPDNVIIYCHDPDMQQKKKPQVLVQDESGKPYYILEHCRKDEIELLAKKHRQLWGCHIFSIDEKPDVSKKIKTKALDIMKRY